MFLFIHKWTSAERNEWIIGFYCKLKLPVWCTLRMCMCVCVCVCMNLPLLTVATYRRRHNKQEEEINKNNGWTPMSCPAAAANVSYSINIYLLFNLKAAWDEWQSETEPVNHQTLLQSNLLHWSIFMFPTCKRYKRGDRKSLITSSLMSIFALNCKLILVKMM